MKLIFLLAVLFNNCNSSEVEHTPPVRETVTLQQDSSRIILQDYLDLVKVFTSSVENGRSLASISKSRKEIESFLEDKFLPRRQQVVELVCIDENAARLFAEAVAIDNGNSSEEHGEMMAQSWIYSSYFREVIKGAEHYDILKSSITFGLLNLAYREEISLEEQQRALSHFD